MVQIKGGRLVFPPDFAQRTLCEKFQVCVAPELLEISKSCNRMSYSIFNVFFESEEIGPKEFVLGRNGPKS